MKRFILSGALLLAGAACLAAQPTTAPPAQQPAPAQAPAAKGPSPEEAKALQTAQAAMQGGDADAVIKAVEDVLGNYPDTQFKAILLTWEASAYQQKRDWIKTQIYGEKAIEADPKSFQAALILADVLSQRTGEHDLDRDVKLEKADKYSKQVIDLVSVAPKPNPAYPDAQWESTKSSIISQAHHDLALSAMVRKNWAVAETEFKTAIAGDPQPAYQVQLASCLQQDGKFDDAIALCDTVLATPNLHPQIAAAAKNIKDVATKAKAAK